MVCLLRSSLDSVLNSLHTGILVAVWHSYAYYVIYSVSLSHSISSSASFSFSMVQYKGLAYTLITLFCTQPYSHINILL